MNFTKDEISEVFKAGFDFRADMENNPSNSEYVEQIFKEKNDLGEKVRDLSHFIEIINNTECSYKNRPADYVFLGMQIISKHTKVKDCSAGHDEIFYGGDEVAETITIQEAKELGQLSWTYSSEYDCLSVGV